MQDKNKTYLVGLQKPAIKRWLLWSNKINSWQKKNQILLFFIYRFAFIYDERTI